jgi:hypothetical protein
MAAKIITLTQAVADLINDAAIAGCPPATRAYYPRFQLAEEKAKLDVVPGHDRVYGRLMRRQSVDAWSDSPSVDVVLYWKVPAGAGATTAGDAAMLAGESITEVFLAAGRVDGYQLVAPNVTPLEHDWALDKGVVGLVINLKFSNP